MINKCPACCSVWPTFKENWGDNPPLLSLQTSRPRCESFIYNEFSTLIQAFFLFAIVKKNKKNNYIYAYANIAMNMVLKLVYYTGNMNLPPEFHCSIIKKVIGTSRTEISSVSVFFFYFASWQTMKKHILKATFRLHKVKSNIFVRTYIWVLQVICLFGEIKKDI